MRVTSDFECGNGKNITEIEPGHFRIEEEGEKAPYCKYFCVRLEGDSQGKFVRLSIYPDPEMGEEGRRGMLGHYPSPLWFAAGDLGFWVPVTNPWPGADTFAEDHIATRVKVEPDTPTYVASNVVWPYSRMVQWAEDHASDEVGCDSLGDSFEGRPIPRVHLPCTGRDPIKVFVMSGQHPSEQCGPIATSGIADFLVSAHPEAKAIRQSCEVWVIPMINVDGNFHGRNGWTMQDVNPFGDFEGASEGQSPEAVEDRLVWDWLANEVKPDLYFNFHGYMGQRRMADYPFDGCYTLDEPEQVFSSPERCAQYAELVDTMLWDTPGLTAHGSTGTLTDNCLENQLARACGTMPAFYEINHGFYAVQGARRRGADVFRAVMRNVTRNA